MGRTSITVRIDEDEKETFSNISESVGVSVQEIVSSFIGQINARYEIISDYSLKEIEESIQHTISELKKSNYLKTESDIESLETQVAFISWLVENNIRANSTLFKDSKSEITENYATLPADEDLYLKPPELYILAHRGLDELSELDEDEMLTENSPPPSVRLRFMICIANKMMARSPKGCIKIASKESYGNESRMELKNEEITLDTSATSTNEITMELNVPYQPLENE